MSADPAGEHPGLSPHARDQCAAGLAHVAQLLHAEFDEVLGAYLVDECLAQVTGTFADATVLCFIPLLVRRYAREQLLGRVAAVEAQGHRKADLLAKAP